MQCFDTLLKTLTMSRLTLKEFTSIVRRQEEHLTELGR